MASPPAPILGFWSHDHGYHSVMEDEWLVFRDDGTGWSAYSVEARYRIEPGTRPLLDEPVSLLTVDLPFLQLDGPYAIVERDEPRRDFLRKAGIQP